MTASAYGGSLGAGTGVSTARCRCGSPIADAAKHRWWHHNRARLCEEARLRFIEEGEYRFQGYLRWLDEARKPTERVT